MKLLTNAENRRIMGVQGDGSRDDPGENKRRMNVAIKLKIARAKVLANKAKQEAQKIAVAVVIAEAVMVVAYAVGESHGILDIFRGETITIVNPAQAQAPKEEAKPEEDDIKAIAAYIYKRESSEGKNNFSKCATIGKVNGIGYGIPGDGSYICFDSHEDEMRTLEGWIIAKRAQGYTDESLLCIYNTGSQKPCEYGASYR